MAGKIQREELREKMERGDDFVLLEALAPEEFERGHLPGARNLPPDRVEQLASKRIPSKDSEVVVYCASADCDASVKTARKLEELGYTNVIDYEGGKADWKSADLASV